MRALPTVTTGAVYNGASGGVIMSDRTWSFANLLQVGSFYINIAGKPNLPPIGGWIGVTVYSFSAEL